MAFNTIEILLGEGRTPHSAGTQHLSMQVACELQYWQNACNKPPVILTMFGLKVQS